MWNRLTQQATQVVFAAQQEALRLASARVGPEHLLLGMVRAGDHVASRVLRRLGVSRRRVRSEIERQVRRGSESNLLDQRLDPAVQRVLHLAVAEAQPLQREWQVGTEHLLLGLLREEGLAAQVLTHCRVDADAVRRIGVETARTNPEDAYNTSGTGR